MNWNTLSYDDAVIRLRELFGFDFVSIGLAPQAGAALRWLHASGASGERYKRIMLSPGHGIGGIVLKAGKPMMFTNIDEQLDPREYSSYPIVFAEDLRSFIALPLLTEGRVSGVLLCAFRSSDALHSASFEKCLQEISDGICGFDVRIEGFMRFDEILSQKTALPVGLSVESGLALAEAREDERRAISRELHDGLAQELLSVSMLVKQMGILHDDSQTTSLVSEAEARIDRLLEMTRNISVQLRPLALDDLGLVPALHSQATLYGKMFGTQISVLDSTHGKRFDRDIETQAYRIAQEGMLNACKYSNSDTVDVIANCDDESLTLAICDQGTGFNVETPTIRGHGCGIRSMRERASIINATLNVYSNCEGTTITLTVPLSPVEGSEHD